jgi:hypothetical protein
MTFMRSTAGLALAFGLLLVPELGWAQAAKPAANHGPSRSSSQFTLRREEAGGADAAVARSRARAGDCQGALAGFDAAIDHTIDPGLRRDRGLCHEKLNHPYPAMDDYRAYLTARPDAPDSDQIRQRLAQLEEQTGQGGPSSQSVKAKDNDGGGSASGEASASGGGGKAEASASMSIGGSSSSSSSSKGAKGSRAKDDDDGSGSSKGFDYYAAQEKKADDADYSALRYGEGFIIGAFLHFPRYFVGDGAPGDAGYGVGGTLRYAMGGALTLTSEFGFAGVGTGGANSAMSGPLLAAGAELKIPITRYASDQILLKGGLGYERYTVSGTRIASNVILGRFALGFRHVFGPSLAFDLLFDGGPAYFIPEVGDNKMRGYVAGSAAFLVAF